MGGVGGATSPAALDRWLNLGFLGAGLAVALATAMHAGPNPWESYQTAVAVNPIETKVRRCRPSFPRPPAPTLTPLLPPFPPGLHFWCSL
jgi:hypothetical protein